MIRHGSNAISFSLSGNARLGIRGVNTTLSKATTTIMQFANILTRCTLDRKNFPALLA